MPDAESFAQARACARNVKRLANLVKSRISGRMNPEAPTWEEALELAQAAEDAAYHLGWTRITLEHPDRELEQTRAELERVRAERDRLFKQACDYETTVDGEWGSCDMTEAEAIAEALKVLQSGPAPGPEAAQALTEHDVRGRVALMRERMERERFA